MSAYGDRIQKNTLSQSVFLEALTSPYGPQNKYLSSKYPLEIYSIHTYNIIETVSVKTHFA